MYARNTHGASISRIGRLHVRVPRPAALPVQVLNPDYLARLLLLVHSQLELARDPRHQAQALAPLAAMLALLEGRVCEPSTFRYTASILLRLLSVRCGWPACLPAWLPARLPSCALMPRLPTSQCFCLLYRSLPARVSTNPVLPSRLCRELQEQCCSLLAGMVERMLGQSAPGDLAPLGAMLPALLSTLAEGIEAEHSAGRPLDTPAAKAMLALVGKLTIGAPDALKAHLEQVAGCQMLPGQGKLRCDGHKW